MSETTGNTINGPLYCYLYSIEGKCRVGDVFADEDKLWAYAEASGYCCDEIDREDADPRRVLNAGYEIHESTKNGDRVGMNARNERV
jgi:hypothetical protein